MKTACLIACLPFILGFSPVSAVSWSYDDVTDWATSHPSYCNGSKQSPIDLDSSQVQYEASFRSAAFSFSNFDATNGITWTLTNNGHSAQVNVGGTAMQVSGGSLSGTFQVVQFHFHWGSDDTKGSEHTVDTLRYPLEMHIVTYNTEYVNASEASSHSDGLAVLGFFFEVSASDNSDMASIVTGLSSVTTKDQSTSITPVALEKLMTDTADYYRYSGGLTTPTCDEVVTWTVFKDPNKISKTQLSAFRTLQDSHSAILVNNYRPVQPLNSRTVKASFKTSAAVGVEASTLLTLSAASLLTLTSLH